MICCYNIMNPPVSKQYTSFQHPFSSQPPNNHTTWSTSVALCALIPRVGIWPYAGALLQYMHVVGASSTSFECGKRGRIRTLGFAGLSLELLLLSRGGASEPELLLGVKACFRNELLDSVASRTNRSRSRTPPDDFRDIVAD